MQLTFRAKGTLFNKYRVIFDTPLDGVGLIQIDFFSESHHNLEELLK
jgi:hypothetical protein